MFSCVAGMGVSLDVEKANRTWDAGSYGLPAGVAPLLGAIKWPCPSTCCAAARKVEALRVLWSPQSLRTYMEQEQQQTNEL
jgi:hypothetical protein